jgi:peptide/nickel transport system substrate-binding protein
LIDLKIIDAADYGVALTGWDSGLFFHPTGLPTDIINQAASMWIQGLSGTVLGLTSVMRPDDLNETILAARSTATKEEAQALMQDAQVMMIDQYCLFWPIGVGYYTWILSPKLHDSGINDIKYDMGTLEKAWIEE